MRVMPHLYKEGHPLHFAHFIYDKNSFEHHMSELNRFLNINTKELVIVDLVMQFPCIEMEIANPKESTFTCKRDENGVNHYEEIYFTELKRIFEDQLGSKLCPEMCPSTVSLNYLESINCNVIVLYGLGRAPDFMGVQPNFPDGIEVDPATGWAKNEAKNTPSIYWDLHGFDKLRNKPENSWGRSLIGGISSGDHPRALRGALQFDINSNGNLGSFSQRFTDPNGDSGSVTERFGEFFHHTQSFFSLQAGKPSEKIISNYATYVLTGGIQMMAKQRQMQNTLQQALLTTNFSRPINIISSDFVDGTFARTVIKRNYNHPKNFEQSSGDKMCDEPLDGGTNWSEWTSPIPETCADGCGGTQERHRQCSKCSSEVCGFERKKDSFCALFEVEELPCDGGGSTCPQAHPWAYQNGNSCCRTKLEKVEMADGQACDGSQLHFDSGCCQNDDHQECSNPPCHDNGDETVYVGCFADTNDRDLDGPVLNSADMTVQNCISFCANQNYVYAGVQAADWCHCGNSFGKHGQASNCDKACFGASDQICGGSWANNVYRIGNQEIVQHEIAYVGCFADTDDRDLDGPVSNSEDMTVDNCISFCANQNYVYAGVQFGQECLCGNSFGKYGQASNCDHDCSGASDQVCGGLWANSVYGITERNG